MKSATRINEFTADIVIFCNNDPYLFKESLKERENFLSSTPEKYYKTQDEKNWAEQRFYDYFMFSCISQYYEQTPLEVFLSKMLSKYNQQEQKILLGFKNHIFSAFTVTEVEVGFYFMAQDLTTKKEYKVRENQATHTLKEGDYIIGRIVLYETDYALSNINLNYPKESSYTLKKLWRNSPANIKQELTPLIIEEEIFQKNYPKRNQEKNNLPSIEKKLKNSLKKYLGKRAPSIKNLRKKINRMIDPLPLIKEIAERINFSSQEELNKFHQLFIEFWNLSPRDEFQGKSPLEIEPWKMGPQEKELSQELMNYVLTNIQSLKYYDQEEIDDAIKIYQDKWLHQILEELDHKTPWQVILEERERLGNPRKDFSLKISIKPVQQKMKDRSNLSDITRKNVPGTWKIPEIIIEKQNKKGLKMNHKPSIQEWQDLYKAAIQFKKTKCWNWMWETDLFGVQNPVTGEIGYCCIMGGAGEHFALAVYLGSKGLKGYLALRSKENLPSLQEILNLQKLLMASFEDRELLQKEDVQLIKKLGLKFSGPDSCPLFRSYRPGCHPWYLTGEEARYLTLCLRQAIDVSTRFKADSEMLSPSKKNHYLVRVPKKEKTGFSWRDEWIKPLPFKKAEMTVEPIDEILLEKIKRRIPYHQGIWEVDFFYSPKPIKEKEERPFYPYITLWVDHHSGFILSHDIDKPAKSISEFPGQFLILAEKYKTLPQEILVRKEETFNLLEPITSVLGIKLRTLKRLSMLEEAQADMSEFFAGENDM